MTATSEHVHKFEPDPVMGPMEERCVCGLWRCVYVHGVTSKRCTDPADGVKPTCHKHARHVRELELEERDVAPQITP